MAKPRPAGPKAGIFTTVSATPAAVALQARTALGGIVTCPEVTAGAQPFWVAMLAGLFPARTILVVTEGLKAQEGFHADLATWIRDGR